MENIQNEIGKTEKIKGPAGYLHVDDGGKGGTPVIFAHSFAGSSEHWQRQLEFLRKDRRAVAFDFRGHGNSDLPRDADYSAEALADDIAAVADGLNVKRFHLVGHSMGGTAAIAFAEKYPDRVVGLLLAGTPGKSEAEQGDKIVAALQSDAYQKVMDDYMKQLMENSAENSESVINNGMKKMSKPASVNIIRSMFRYNPLPALENFEGRKMIIYTEREDQQPASLHRQLPAIPAYKMEGTSHWTQLDKPDEFNEVLAKFLSL
jgi:pimeloyl-ACP methyl ester carboxylesterase